MAVVLPTLEPAPLDDPVVVALTTASLAEIDAHYHGQPGSGAPPRREDFAAPNGAFLVARLENLVSGCGGISRLDDVTAEVRRMYVVPEARGRGVARAILAGLLERARELGYSRARLETGHLQTEALGLYRSAGFAPCPCWGPYVHDPRSRCFELALS